MTNELDIHIKTELTKFNMTDAAIAQMEKEYLPLKIKGMDDKEGYSLVRTARIFVKGKRVEIEKTRKVLKEESLLFGRAVDTEAKRITAKLETIEGHLSKQENAIDAEKERIKQAKLDEEAAALAAIEAEARAKREAEEAAERAEFEAKRIRLEAIEQEQIKREAAIQKAQEKVDAEKRAIADAKQKAIEDKKRQAELEQARKEATEAARIEAEQKAEREAKKKVEAEIAARIEAEREAALRPDKDKLEAFADAISQIATPTLTDPKAKGILKAAAKQLLSTVVYIRQEVEGL